MRLIRFLCLLTAMASAIAVKGYDPQSPSEPGEVYVSASLLPAGSGSVSMTNSGRGLPGTQITLTASPYTNYNFVRWEDADGEVLSTERSMKYVLKNTNTRVYARMNYSPAAPNEPTTPVTYANVYASAKPSQGGSVSGAGKYAIGTNVTLRASAASNYVFVNWTRDEEIVSPSQTVTITVPENGDKLTANFRYSPGSPGEPEATVTKYKLNLRTEPSGGMNLNVGSGNKYAPGQSVYLRASTNSGYEFRRWTDEDGNVLSYNNAFYFSMPDKESTLTAHAVYSPASPNEPTAPTIRRNLIYGARVSQVVNTPFVYDINLENIDECTGVSIDFTKPEGYILEGIDLTDRTPTHTVSVDNISGDVYRISIRGTEPVKGGGGAVMKVRLKPDGQAPSVGETVIMPLAKGVLVKADGSQIAIDALNGSVFITEAPEVIPDSPDFVVSDISTTGSDVAPGSEIEVSWVVGNIGTAPAYAGWTENLWLIDANGKRAALGSLYYDLEMLAVGDKVNRKSTLTIPQLPGLDGKINIGLTLSPSPAAFEHESKKLNNSAETENFPLTLSKALVLEMPSIATEGTDGTLRCRLARSGSWAASETFRIALQPTDSRLVVPEQVTIPRDQSAAYFLAKIDDNDSLDDLTEFTLTASGNGYAPESVAFTVIDNEFPEIDLDVASNEVTEGDTFELRLSLPAPAPENITVSLSCDAPARLRMPANVVIPKGQTEARINVTAVDNNDVEDVTDITIRATAAHYEAGETFILLADNDMPVLEMDIAPAEVSEGAGPMAIRCNLRRLSNIDKHITVLLSDDSSKQLTYTKQRITLEPGVEQIDFCIGVADNDRVDGERTVTITASVFLTGCSCSASGQNGGTVSRSVVIVDNDGPALTLSASRATLRKDSRKSTLTITRNTPTTQGLEVHLSTDMADMLAIPQVVVIPAGSKDVTIEIEATENAFNGHETALSLYAEATGFAKGIYLLLISDRTLPDAVPGALTIDNDEVLPGTEMNVTAEVRNDGNAIMPDATTVDFYISGQDTFTASVSTPAALSPGEKATVSTRIKAPSVPGKYSLSARVNDAATFAELTAANNTSPSLWFTVLSPFTASVISDRDTYNTGDDVSISGRTPGYTGEVEVYVTDGSLRQTVSTVADDEGNFAATWTPRAGGAYKAGVCVPGENKTDAMCMFNVKGMMFDNSSYLSFDVPVGETKTANLRVRNTSPMTLDHVTVSANNVPATCSLTLGEAVSIAPGATAEIPVSLEALATTSGTDWETFKVTVADGNGLADTKTLYFYGRSPMASLLASISAINTSMTMGTPRTYSFMIANNGKAPTGDITLSLPRFMSLQSASVLPSLAPGEKAEIALLFTPSSEMQLNVPLSGKIGVNCVNGDGLAIPYTIEPVSDSTGRLVIETKDEYTFYTEGAPRVAGADVLVSHPVSGRLIEKGKTDDEGLWMIDLPAGFYKIDVSADRHNSWSGTLEIAPGRDNNIPVFLAFNAITYSWAVEETTVDDSYEIVNTVEFETRVPKPVVLVSFPELYYTNQMAYITITNKGLIEARNITVSVPEGNEHIRFELLGDNTYETLGAGQSIYVPMRVYVDYEEPEQKLRMSVQSYEFTADYDASEASKAPAKAPARLPGACQTHSTYVQVDDYVCDNLTGEPIYTGTKTIEGTYYTGECSSSALSRDRFGPVDPNIGLGWGNFYLPTLPSPPGVNPVDIESTTYFADRLNTILTTGCVSDCEKALAEAIQACLEALKNCREAGKWEDFDPKSCVKDIAENCFTESKNEEEAIDNAIDCGKNAAGCFPPLACPADIFDCIRKAYKAFKECIELYRHLHNQAPAKVMAASAENDDDEILLAKELRAETIDLMARMKIAAIDKLRNLLGDGNWSAATNEDISGMLTWVQAHRDSNGYIAMNDSRLGGKPATVSVETYDIFLERINNSMRYALEGVQSDNIFDLNRAIANEEEMQAIRDRVADMGFPDFEAFATTAGDNYNNYLEMGEEPSAGVCASITLKFTQTMVMTRQAFRGTLSITNGNDKIAMTDIRLTMKVRDDEGNMVGEREFAIAPESLDGFTGNLSLTDGWSLAANATGEATVLFIPSRYAAPVEPKVYSFGGVLSYIDPFTGTEVSRELTPIDMLVSPSPLLDLTYFMQRDVIGDDPLTPDVIESSQPAEFALVIDNKGFGAARNVRITTRSPEIVENTKGLAIDFDITGSALNGHQAILALGENVDSNFGDIKPQTSAYAQWWFKSSLMGHFINYDVKATQLSAYGSEDMSLLDRVEVHELIHGLTPAFGNTEDRAFLVNDIDDVDTTPDMLYFSDGTAPAEVAKVASASYSEMTDNACIVTVSPSSASDWNYGCITDSQFGRRKVESVVRLSDNAQIAPDNFWTSFVTLRNSTAPKYEDRLHFVVETRTTEQYKVTFTPVPVTELHVVSIEGVPDDHTLLLTPLKSVSVKFSKPVEEATFSADDIMIRCQGKAIDASGVTISRATDWSEANALYDVDIKDATSLSGYYTLSIDCAGITDNEGFNGSSVASASWNQLSDGMVEIHVVANPTEGGEVTPMQGRFDIGEMSEFTAIPAEGFDFVSWSENGRELSRSESLSYTAERDATIDANFVIRRYNIDINYDPEKGSVTGATSGIYPHHTNLTMMAIPADEHEFSGWYADGNLLSVEPELQHTVTDHKQIEALFSRVTTSLGTVAATEKLHVYPVPTSDRLYVDGEYSSSDSYTFIDAKGSRVTIMSGFTPGVPINVSRLVPGIYIVILKRTDGSTASARIVKL